MLGKPPALSGISISGLECRATGSALLLYEAEETMLASS